MLVTALTVTLAFAQGGLLQVLRNGLQYVDRVAAVFVVLTGLYLSWYWYAAIAEKKTGLARPFYHKICLLDQVQDLPEQFRSADIDPRP